MVSKLGVAVWLSLILIAFIVAAIDVMTSKIIALDPEHEEEVLKIVFNDVWYRISVLMFLIPASFAFYLTRDLHRSVVIIFAGLILIFFGIEDLFYYQIKLIPYPELSRRLTWLDTNPYISTFGHPVTFGSLLISAAFAIISSFVIAVIIPGEYD